jgi:hypothetical protein
LLPDRLNYPSLVPQEYLYGNEGELVERLVELLARPELLEPQSATSLAAGFDWPDRAASFDTAFEQAAVRA